jgi:uncharacterized membrane protein
MTSPQALDRNTQTSQGGSGNAQRPQGLRGGPLHNVTQALGWISVGVGVAKIAAPRWFSGAIGTKPRPTTTRLMGAGSLIAGMGILSNPRPSGWLWARAGGNALAMACLAQSNNGRASAALGAVAGTTVLDVLCAKKTAEIARSNFGNEASRLFAAVIINRSPEECYRYWRDIEKLPTFLSHLKSVRVMGEKQSHWVSSMPHGKDIEWDAEITEDTPNELLSWRSLPGADVPNSGSVRFERAHGGRGTMVRVRMQYELPARIGASLVSAVVGRDPGLRVRKDLMRFKQLLETGEIATTEGQPAGRPQGATWMDRMARI